MSHQGMRIEARLKAPGIGGVSPPQPPMRACGASTVSHMGLPMANVCEAYFSVKESMSLMDGARKSIKN